MSPGKIHIGFRGEGKLSLVGITYIHKTNITFQKTYITKYYKPYMLKWHNVRGHLIDETHNVKLRY